MDKIFELIRVSAGYNRFEVLRGINLTISSGDFLSIIGPNGAGKTTLLKILSSDHTACSGKVFFKGKGLHEYNRKQLSRQLSVVYQHYANELAFTVYQFVRLARFPFQKFWEIENSEDSVKIEEAMAITGIEHLRNRSITKLSAGERQLVYIAHSLCQNKDIIILDEPISHLDIKHMTVVMDVLYELNKSGSTIVAVLHNINAAANYSTTVCGMKQGRIVFNGPPGRAITVKNIKYLYDTDCYVETGSITGKPFVSPVPGYINKKEGV